jgi:asparagine synthase (glutamine-hydrolysing)
MLAWDNTHYLPDDLLFKMDIASMAHGLEVRSPFLDHELVEMCAALPSDWKGDARQGKRLLRDIVAADLPTEILAAPKRGFSVPLEQWWRGPERAQIQAGLETLHPTLRPYINSSHVSRLLDEHQNRGRNHAQRLWSLWVLNVWAGKFLTA